MYFHLFCVICVCVRARADPSNRFDHGACLCPCRRTLAVVDHLTSLGAVRVPSTSNRHRMFRSISSSLSSGRFLRAARESNRVRSEGADPVSPVPWTRLGSARLGSSRFIGAEPLGQKHTVCSRTCSSAAVGQQPITAELWA